MASEQESVCLTSALALTTLGLAARLSLPRRPRGLVIFVHGSGSNRFSSRNQSVAQVLQQAGLATLLFDLLTDQEQCSAPLHGPELMDLSDRLMAVIAQLRQRPLPVLAPGLDLAALPFGLFGSSSGAAVALAAAAQTAAGIRAVVSRGGRPDLVPACLADVQAPTLLVVGSHDVDVLELNTWAAARLQGVHELRVVQGAGHLFSEPGALDQVAVWARDWFLRHLGVQSADAGADVRAAH